MPLQVFAPVEQLVAVLDMAPEWSGSIVEDYLGLFGDTPPSAVLGQPRDRDRNLELGTTTLAALVPRRGPEIRMGSVGHARRASLPPVRRFPIAIIVLVLDFTLPAGRIVAIDGGSVIGRMFAVVGTFRLARRTGLNDGLLHDNGRAQRLRVANLGWLWLKNRHHRRRGAQTSGVIDRGGSWGRDRQLCDLSAEAVRWGVLVVESGSGGGGHGLERRRVCKHAGEAGHGVRVDGVVEGDVAAFLSCVPSQRLISGQRRGDASVKHHVSLVAEGVLMFYSGGRRGVIVHGRRSCREIVDRAEGRGIVS